MFDTPVFKKLAHNDTGAAVGHQGGFVIPKDIEDFFPDVSGAISAVNPTIDVPIRADLIVDGALVDQVDTRYQYQSWGGTRFERRLTSNLSALRNKAVAGDFVLFARDTQDDQRFILTLLRQDSPEYAELERLVGGRRWGVVPGFVPPIGNQDVRSALYEIKKIEGGKFELFDKNRRVLESPQRRKIRNSAFRKRLIELYGIICQASDQQILSPKLHSNIDAAHIVPVEDGGSDDARNGILLTKSLHWAFDKGLFGVSDEYEIIVPDAALKTAPNKALKILSGAKLNLGTAGIKPHLEAIAWHRNNKMI
ncbi:EcoRII N-terminal effector-binding domain-containing protein [uncultured Hoeflea sp.]|uniref:EcoRII N-terminal effector-binding domain-containing protein n=1 Tax=uncultured Hoeflea sp. TaxID=538666 RepID=UPI0030D8F54E|tara:strand:+ start:660 stop:1586 length:927 start_codon:yes stop_codon:yes gene_type:complete